MRRRRAIGFALAALLVSSGPAIAPLLAAPEPAPVRYAERTSLAITLDCAPTASGWQDATLLAPDPLEPTPSEAMPVASAPWVAERVGERDLAPVPEPSALLGLVLGLAAFARVRRSASASHSD